MNRIERELLKPYTALVCLVFVTLSLLASQNCASAPPNLSPAATAAFQGTRAIKGLDLLRDFAIAAGDQQPPLLPEATVRKVVEYHRSAIVVIHDAPAGWKATIQTGLTELEMAIPDAQKAVLTPYLTLARTLIQELIR